MATNKFAAPCAVCDTTVEPGAGMVSGEVGSRSITHADCAATERRRSFTVRHAQSIDAPTFIAMEAERDHIRRFAAIASVAAGVVGAVALSAVLLRDGGDGSSRSTREVPGATTTIVVQVAGVVETRTTESSASSSSAPPPSVEIIDAARATHAASPDSSTGDTAPDADTRTATSPTTTSGRGITG